MTAELRVPRGSASADGDGTENDPPGDPVGGVSRSVAMKMTGHKTEAVGRRYAIVGESDLHEAAAKLDQGKVLAKWCQFQASGVNGTFVSVRSFRHARVAKLADALDLGSSGATHGSSSLPSRTIIPARI